MKWLIIGLLVLVLSVGVALVALPDPGYVLIGYGNYSMETTLLVFLVVLAVVYLLLRILAGLWHVPANLRQWNDRRQERRLRALFNEAIIELSDGRTERAERRLARLTRFTDAPLDVYLSAARAANRLATGNQRDDYLKLARHRYPQAEIAIALVQAELQLDAAQLEQAQTTLGRLRKVAPHNSEVLRLLLHLYLRQQDWPQVRELLPELRRRHVLDADQWRQVAARVYREQLLELAQIGDAEALQSGWRQLPAPVQADEGLLAVYIEQLARAGAVQQAELLLRQQLGRSWNARLVYLYGDLEAEDPASQQRIAERWLEQHPDDPVLLLTLGKISLRNQLWGKARNYFEASIARHPTPEAYRLLGTVLEKLDEADQAADCYRKGIALPGQEMLSAASSAPAGELPQLQLALPTATRHA